MKFQAGDEIDSYHCAVLRHEFLRCHEHYERFAELEEMMITEGRTRELSYKAYNAYSGFIYHLYEFLLGCYARELKNTKIPDVKGKDSYETRDALVQSSAQRVLEKWKRAIAIGSVSADWAIIYSQESIPLEFAKEFRLCRNKAMGHVTYERASSLSLTDFFRKYDKYLLLLFNEGLHFWGKRSDDFPDLKEITEFSVMLEEKVNKLSK